MPRNEYIEHRSSLKAVLRIASTLSSEVGGRPSDSGRQYWSSVVYTKLVVSTKTLLDICPYPKANSHWDLSSVASIVRGNVELWLFFVWFCVETADPDNWYFRTRVFWLMDNRARYRLNEDAGTDVKAEEYGKRRDEIRIELDRSPIFVALPEKKKNEILKGDKSPYIQDDILERIGVSKSFFRMYYRFLSSFVHTGPISIYRMAEHRRGNGEENPYDRAYIGTAIRMATQVLASCAYEMMALHPEAAIRTIQRHGEDTITTLCRYRKTFAVDPQ